MKKDRIQQLLEKYFEGTASRQEEKELYDYFSGETSPEWRIERRQLEIFRSGRELSFPAEHLESTILKTIEEYEKQNDPPAKKLNLTRYLVAASISIALILSGIFIYRSTDKRIADTYSDPQLAYAETQKTLLFISQKMNEGMKPLNNIEKINTGTEQLKNLEKIDKSLGMLNLVSFINQSSNLKK